MTLRPIAWLGDGGPCCATTHRQLERMHSLARALEDRSSDFPRNAITQMHSDFDRYTLEPFFSAQCFSPFSLSLFYIIQNSSVSCAGAFHTACNTRVGDSTLPKRRDEGNCPKVTPLALSPVSRSRGKGCLIKGPTVGCEVR